MRQAHPPPLLRQPVIRPGIKDRNLISVIIPTHLFLCPCAGELILAVRTPLDGFVDTLSDQRPCVQNLKPHRTRVQNVTLDGAELEGCLDGAKLEGYAACAVADVPAGVEWCRLINDGMRAWTSVSAGRGDWWQQWDVGEDVPAIGSLGDVALGLVDMVALDPGAGKYMGE